MIQKLRDMKPAISTDPKLASPDQETMGDSLSPDRFSDIYRVAQDEGLSYFYRIDGTGQVSFMIIFDHIDDFAESTSGQVYLEFEIYQKQLLAVIWTMTDPSHPLGFPVKFDMSREEGLFGAIQLLEQDETWIHYLAWQDDDLIHVFSEAITFADSDKENVAENIWNALNQSETEEQTQNAVSLLTIDQLDEDDLCQNGMEYLLDYDAMLRRLGQEEKAREQVMGTVSRILEVMRRHPKAMFRESSLTIWVGEKKGTNRSGKKTRLLSLAVTSDTAQLYQLNQVEDMDEHPFYTFFLAIPEFVRTGKITPLVTGAYPIIHYQNGQISYLEPDEQVKVRLAQLFDSRYSGEDNPYRE
ncbi:MAG: hypothetical protein H0Z33_01195 [Bacillaceae bacterium]|nr:hypothetical protein [Bacillaceae bacterium]